MLLCHVILPVSKKKHLSLILLQIPCYIQFVTIIVYLLIVNVKVKPNYEPNGCYYTAHVIKLISYLFESYMVIYKPHCNEWPRMSQRAVGKHTIGYLNEFPPPEYAIDTCLFM